MKHCQKQIFPWYVSRTSISLPVTWRQEGSQEDLFSAYKYLMGGDEEEAARLFSGMPVERTTDNKRKLKFRKVNLNARKRVFTMKMVKHWNQLPREDSESHQ